MACVSYGPDALERHYVTAAQLQQDAEALGLNFSREIAAQKVAEAREVFEGIKNRAAA